MIGFFEYLMNNTGVILGFLIGGGLYGMAMSLGREWKEKFQMASIAAVFFGFVLSPVVIKVNQMDNNRHYATCSKYEAKQAGYIFAEERCWKPVKSYIKVNGTTKTKQELLNAK